MLVVTMVSVHLSYVTHYNNNTTKTKNVKRNKASTSCALLFFGLPRCFRKARRSIQKYILNANPTCHIYLHTYNLTILPGNPRGNIPPSSEVDINDVYKLTNNVAITNMNDFYKSRNVSYYRQYFPEGLGWNYPVSMDNMIKQWHSI